VLEHIPWQRNSNDFVFDNQILSQAIYCGYRVGEITCPAKYFPDASSINFTRSLRYGWGCLMTAVHFALSRGGISRSALFSFPGINKLGKDEGRQHATYTESENQYKGMGSRRE
jgi:hypothetical protein